MYWIRPYRDSKTELEVDIKVRMPDGSWHRERKKSPVKSKSGTERWAQARERELLLGGITPKAKPKKAVVTLEKFWPRFINEHCRAQKQKPSGIESKEYHYRQYLGPLFGKLPLDQIDNAAVARLRAYMASELGGKPTKKSRKGKGASTINNCSSTLSKCLKCAVDWGELGAMPCKIGRLRTAGVAPKFYEYDVYERLVQAAAELDARTHVAVLLGGDAGLRKGEILALEQRCCDTQRGRTLVELNEVKGESVATKGMQFRTVPMTSRLKTAIAALKHRRHARLLVQDDGTPWTESTLRSAFRAAQLAAKLPKATGEAHILRHTFCSHLAMKGAPVRSIQTLAGHKHIATSLRYMHLAPGETDRAVALLEQGRDQETSARTGGPTKTTPTEETTP